MSFTGNRRSHVIPKIVGIYSKLFQGIPPEQINPNQDIDHFYDDLLALKVDANYIEEELKRTPKEACVGQLKPFLSNLFLCSVKHAREASYDDSKKSNSLQTLIILARGLLAKTLSGWEIMEVFAGTVSQSDTTFMEFAIMVRDIIADDDAPAVLRRQSLRLALVYMCAIGQLSPGAYFLRCDLFPAISTYVKSSKEGPNTFEALLLLGILANYHKSDAAKLNPYLKRIRHSSDISFMKTVAWGSNFAVVKAIKAYQDILDDSPTPSLRVSLGSAINSFRPHRAFSPRPVEASKELFKNLPVEDSAILLPLYEFLCTNSTYISVWMETIREKSSGQLSPPPFTTITLVSYILAHASSTFSPRSIAYANLSLNILLTVVEHDGIMDVFCREIAPSIRLCRQKLPHLPIPPASRAPICSVLDCCVLWLRHNLHLQLEANLYINCIWVCYRIVWFLQDRHIRLEYDWSELWSAIMGLPNFISTKITSLTTIPGMERLVYEMISLVDLCICKSDVYLASPEAIHHLIYELLRFLPGLRAVAAMLEPLTSNGTSTSAGSRRYTPGGSVHAKETLVNIIAIGDYYEGKVSAARARTAKEAMRVVLKEIEGDGLHRTGEARVEEEPPKRSEEVVSFSRYACMDGLTVSGRSMDLTG